MFKEMKYIIHAAKDLKERADEFERIMMKSGTINDFVRSYMKGYPPEEIRKQKNLFKTYIHEAVHFGIIKPTAKINGNTDYSKYNWNEIAEMTTSDIFSSI